jgi:hypothetical protein
MLKTYGDVLQLTEAKLGEGGCAFDTQEFLFACEHCLSTVSDEVDPQFYNSIHSFTLVDGIGIYSIPSGFTVTGIKNLNGFCLTNTSPTPTCAPAPVLTATRYDVDCNIPVAQQAYPRTYHVTGSSVRFDQLPVLPVGTNPVTWSMEGYRAATGPFYVDTTAGNVITRTWQAIDLPVEYQTAFTLCVLGNLLLDKDPGQASNYFALANDSLKSARSRKAKRAPKAMFARKGNVDPCCSNGGFPRVRQFESSLLSDCGCD